MKVSSGFLFFSAVLLLVDASSAQPGFLSLDCGGNGNFTDELGIAWISDYQMTRGGKSRVFLPNETRKQYTTARYFPADSRKYCYTLPVEPKSRYLVRATFLYGNFDFMHTYPKFDISLGATYWSTIVISDPNTTVMTEMIFLATAPIISVCLYNARSGRPFISTLELRFIKGSAYYTDYEYNFYLKTTARINFGALSDAPVRYPDDPLDRIWVSDSVRNSNLLNHVAPGTAKVYTNNPIYVDTDEVPPQKVMQTAVVGANGFLNYSLQLDDFPGNGWAFCYFAEIESLGTYESRQFTAVAPGHPAISQSIIDIKVNAGGDYRLYETGEVNVKLPYILPLGFKKSVNSTRGPLLNAMEINKYIQKINGSIDSDVMESLVSRYPAANWAQEGGDPCLPAQWSWLRCNSGPQPKILSVFLSRKKLTGNIPTEFTRLSGLVELWLDGNSLTGPIPDFSQCKELKIIHLENNQLTGEFPSSLTNLPHLKELYVQNNMLSGKIPSGVARKNLVLNYSGNVHLHKKDGKGMNIIIVGSSVAVTILLIVTITSCVLINKGKKRNCDQEQVRSSMLLQSSVSMLSDAPSDASHYFSLSEIEDATRMFEKKIGVGGFGVVFYGKLEDGREIAVKVLNDNSFQGRREFSNEVTLLSRIHHRNLVKFLGYVQEEGKSILVYEFMHNGTLREHLYGPGKRDGHISWIKRLEIAEESAKGIEYLHTGCVPAIIHRDLKSSNILLDRHMRAKVSDFGLSRFAADGLSHVSSVVRGTLGYLDPEYYISQKLTDKSDVYSFGVILLELISGQGVISFHSSDSEWRNIVQWAKLHIENGDIQGIIDPSLENEYDMESMWKIAETALLCVLPQGHMRPSISEVLKEIQDALAIEKEAQAAREDNPETVPKSCSIRSPIHAVRFSLVLDDSIAEPLPR